MFRRKRVDILFAIAYIAFIALLITLLMPTKASGEVAKKQVYSFNVDDIVDAVAEKMIEVQYELEQVEIPQYKSLGTFFVTAYCPCKECSGRWGNQTSTGVTAVEGVTIAVDPSVIPYGTKVYIDGHEYIAQDCGSAINGFDIDIFFEDHEVADEWGEQYKEVFILIE